MTQLQGPGPCAEELLFLARLITVTTIPGLAVQEQKMKDTARLEGRGPRLVFR